MNRRNLGRVIFVHKSLREQDTRANRTRQTQEPHKPTSKPIFSSRPRVELIDNTIANVSGYNCIQDARKMTCRGSCQLLLCLGSHSHSRRNQDSGLARPIKCIWNFGFTHSIASSPQPSRVSRDVARMAVVNSRSDTYGTRLPASCQSPEFASALDTSWAECIFFRAFGGA